MIFLGVGVLVFILVIIICVCLCIKLRNRKERDPGVYELKENSNTKDISHAPVETLNSDRPSNHESQSKHGRRSDKSTTR